MIGRGSNAEENNLTQRYRKVGAWSVPTHIP